jgi:hypothetical protein
MEQYGEDALLDIDSKKLSGFIADSIPRDIKTKNLLDMAIKADIPKKLYAMKSMDEINRGRQIKSLCVKFADDYSISEESAYKTVNYFVSAFGFKEAKFKIPAPRPVKPKKNFTDSPLYKIFVKLRGKLYEKWKNRRKLSDIENYLYKSFFWTITLILALGIYIAAVSSFSPYIVDFMQSLELFEPASGDILENAVYHLTSVMPYLLFAAGMGNTIIYNKKAMKFRDISWYHCVKSGGYCVLGHILMILLVCAGFLLINIIVSIAPAEIAPPAETLIYLIMPSVLIMGVFGWGLRIFIEKKIAGFITLSVVILFTFVVYLALFFNTGG